jgi:hypothetical protein
MTLVHDRHRIFKRIHKSSGSVKNLYKPREHGAFTLLHRCPFLGFKCKARNKKGSPRQKIVRYSEDFDGTNCFASCLLLKTSDLSMDAQGKTMGRWTTLLFLFFGSLNSLAAEMPATCPGDQGRIITLIVGGKKFVTTRRTLCRFPDSPLGIMFSKNKVMKPSDLTEEGYYFLDDDSNAFEKILFFLLYNQLDFKDPCEAARTRVVADKLLPQMLKPIDDWCKVHKPHSEIILTSIRKTTAFGDLWFICKAPGGEIVGSNDFGAELEDVQDYLDEYNKRKVYKDLCYAWSGYGISICNCQTETIIGEYTQEWKTHEILPHNRKFLNLNLIENAVRGKDNLLYVCTFNNLGTFSIFNAITGVKMLPKESFATVQECASVLAEYIRASFL